MGASRSLSSPATAAVGGEAAVGGGGGGVGFVPGWGEGGLVPWRGAVFWSGLRIVLGFPGR
jgi:hypothetical protein